MTRDETSKLVLTSVLGSNRILLYLAVGATAEAALMAICFADQRLQYNNP